MKNVQIINRIIEIEASAQELIKNAENEQQELPAKIARILEEHSAEYRDKAAKIIENARISEDEIAKEKIGQILEEHKIKTDKLNKMVDENIGCWIDRVYDFIITPTDMKI